MPHGTGKEQLWVTYLFFYCSHFSLIDNLLADSIRIMPASLMLRSDSILRVSSHPFFTSFFVAFSDTDALSSNILNCIKHIRDGLLENYNRMNIKTGTKIPRESIERSTQGSSTREPSWLAGKLDTIHKTPVISKIKFSKPGTTATIQVTSISTAVTKSGIKISG